MPYSLLILLFLAAILLIVLALWLLFSNQGVGISKPADFQVVESVSVFSSPETGSLNNDLNLPSPAVSERLSFPLSYKLKTALFVGAVLAAVGLLAFNVVNDSYHSDQETYELLQRTGRETSALVVTKLRGSENHEPSIQYYYHVILPDGRDWEWRNWADISRGEYNEIILGQTEVAIVYSTTVPHISVLRRDFHPPDKFRMRLGLLAAGVFLVPGLVILVGFTRHIFRIVVLNYRGEKTIGIVFDKWEQTGWIVNKKPMIQKCVSYYFEVQIDEKTRWRIVRTEDYQSAYQTLSTNDTVKVRYLPDKPKICRLEL